MLIHAYTTKIKIWIVTTNARFKVMLPLGKKRGKEAEEKCIGVLVV